MLINPLMLWLTLKNQKGDNDQLDHILTKITEVYISLFPAPSLYKLKSLAYLEGDLGVTGLFQLVLNLLSYFHHFLSV